MSLQSHEHDERKMEEQENANTIAYERSLEEFAEAMDNVLAQAKEDGLEEDDLLKAIEKAWGDNHNSSLYTELKEF